MSEALEKKEQTSSEGLAEGKTILDKVNPQIQLNILTMIHSGEIETAEDITYNFPSVKIDDAVALLNNEEFYTRICNHTTARVKLLFHGKGIQALDNALTHGDHKDALAAYDRVAKLNNSDGGKSKRPINIGFFSLEEVLESSSGEKIVKGKVLQTSTPAEEGEFKPGLKKKSNYIPRSKVNGNIFEASQEEEETETIYINESEEEYGGEEEWDE